MTGNILSTLTVHICSVIEMCFHWKVVAAISKYVENVVPCQGHRHNLGTFGRKYEICLDPRVLGTLQEQ